MTTKDRYYIYILRCCDGSLYTGIAKDYRERYKEHVEGRGAKYTRSRKPRRIEGVWEACGRSNASKVEWYVKSHPKIRKEYFLTEGERLAREILDKYSISIRRVDIES